LTQRILLLKRAVKLLLLFAVLSLLFVGADFLTTEDIPQAREMTRLPLPELDDDQAYFLRLDNKQLVIVKYSSRLRGELFNKPLEPKNPAPEYLVAFAYGTNMGCPLEQSDQAMQLKESCSQAHYDFAGRPLDNTQGFTALRVPVYNFCPDKSCLNVSLK
jgi:hypothetical protein